MKEFTAQDAQRDFGRLLREARLSPVRVVQGAEVGVVMSAERYERLRGAAWDRLSATMDRMAASAKAAGLDDATLEALLAEND